MTYTGGERETIGLCIALEATDSIISPSLATLVKYSDGTSQAEFRFETRQHQQLFLVRLLDFAREAGDKDLTGVKGSCLDVLREVGRTGFYERNGGARNLERAATTLADWLSSFVTAKLWLPTLDIDANLNVPRADFLYIAGNQVKHNLARLTGVSKRIADTLRDSGHTFPPEFVPLALEEFQEHLQHDYFAYYGTWIAEMVNDVRWAIHDYLFPAFQEAYRRDLNDDIAYTYAYPTQIGSRAGQAWFWRLMNHIRKGPALPRFTTPESLKTEPAVWQ